MNKILTIATVLAATCVAAPSFAADNAMGSGSGSNSMDSTMQTPNTGGLKTDMGTTASVGNKFDEAIAGIQLSKDSARRVKTMSKVSSVHVVDVGHGSVKKQAALTKAIGDNRAGVVGLQDAIDKNASLKAKLRGKSVDPSDVVATKLRSDGSLTVYVDKSA